MSTTSQTIFETEHLWSEKYPGASAGIVVIEKIDSKVSKESTTRLEELKGEVENQLRSDYAGYTREKLNELSVIQAYNDYYKDFGKTYHVRAQVESILGGKPLASRSPIVSAMFMAEVKNMLLTAGHDLAKLELPIRIGISSGQNFTDIRGAEKKTMPGDMMMQDGSGVVSSIVLGPDSRTKVTDSSQDVLFAVYAPAGISTELVHLHLQDIERYVKAFSEHAETTFLQVFSGR